MSRFSDLAALVLVLLVVAGGIGLYRMGISAKQQEMDALRAANDRAIAAAEKDLREDLSLVITEKKRLENAYAELVEQAQNDARADACGISGDSVRRLRSLK